MLFETGDEVVDGGGDAGQDRQGGAPVPRDLQAMGGAGDFEYCSPAAGDLAVPGGVRRTANEQGWYSEGADFAYGCVKFHLRLLLGQERGQPHARHLQIDSGWKYQSSQGLADHTVHRTRFDGGTLAQHHVVRHSYFCPAFGGAVPDEGLGRPTVDAENLLRIPKQWRLRHIVGTGQDERSTLGIAIVGHKVKSRHGLQYRSYCRAPEIAHSIAIYSHQ